MSTSIKKNFAYKSALTISTYLMNLVTFPYVSRVLGVEGIGLVSFVDNTVNYFLLFATMGVGLLGTREIATVKEHSQTCGRVFANILGMNLTFTIVTLIIYLLCILCIPQFYQYKELFYIGTAKILFTAFLIEWFFSGIEHFHYITVRSLLVKLLYVVAVFIWVRQPEDYKLYFLMTVGVVVLNAVVNIVYVHKFVSLRWAEMLKIDWKYVKQNISLGIYAIMTSMYLTFNVMFLGLFADNTQVGYYTTAFKLYTVVLGLFTAFTNVMLPRMSALLAGDNKEQFQQLIDKSFFAMFTFSIPMILCSMALAPNVVYVLSGSGYEGAILPMRIIMPAALFVGIAQILALQILMPMRRDKVLLIASIVGALTSLLINILFVPRYQSIGTAIVLLCSELTVTAIYIGYVIRKQFASISLVLIGKNCLVSLPSLFICFACVYWIPNPFLSLGVALIVGGGIWLGLCCWIKNELVLSLLSKIKR